MSLFKRLRSRTPRSSSDAPATLGESLEQQDELLFQFFDFFDSTIDATYRVLRGQIEAPEEVLSAIHDIYVTLLKRKRFFFWKNELQQQELTNVIQNVLARTAGNGASSEKTQAHSLSAQEKNDVRQSLLREYQAMQASRVQYIVPTTMIGSAAAVVLFVGSAFMIEPVTIGKTATNIAAAEVLLLHEHRAIASHVDNAENAIRSLLSTEHKNTMAMLALSLSSHAVTAQEQLEQEVAEIAPLIAPSRPPVFQKDSLLSEVVFHEKDSYFGEVIGAKITFSSL